MPTLLRWKQFKAVHFVDAERLTVQLGTNRWLPTDPAAIGSNTLLRGVQIEARWTPDDIIAMVGSLDEPPGPPVTRPEVT